VNCLIKNFIFDIGNVLLNFKPLEYLKTKISESDIIDDVYYQVFKSEEWILLDRGMINEKEAYNRIIERNSQYKYQIKNIFEEWQEMLTPIEDTICILKELKNASFKIYFLSNFHSTAFDYVIKQYGFFDLFDGGIVSYKENLIKPEAAIYEKLIKKYNLTALESFFIDDMEENIHAAKLLDFNTMIFTCASELKIQLKMKDIYN